MTQVKTPHNKDTNLIAGCLFMNEFTMSRSQRRALTLFCFLILGLSALFLRIFLVATGEDLQTVAKNQSSYTLTVDQSRGMIYDCNFKPLVNGTEQYVLSVLPCDEAAQALMQSVPYGEREKLLKLFDGGRPFLYEFDSPYIYAQGINVFTVKQRYSENQPAVHVIGHLDGEGTGVYGIEKAYDALLAANSGKLTVTYAVDALRRPLTNVSPEITRTNYNNREGVVLTIDSDIQQIAEQEGARLIKKGAVLVMEAATGKIRAAASFPAFDPNNVAASLDDSDSPLVNRCFSAYNVGSTFKLSGVAAALEKDIPLDYTYTCTGSIEVNGIKFYCHNRAGHGEIGLDEAMQRSCNPYFINLAMQTGYDKLYEMAVRFGFGKANNLTEVTRSAAGNLPDMESLRNNAVLANFAFGQGELTATPIQIARMICVFANGGTLVTPTLVEGISDKAGQEIASPYEPSPSYRMLSSANADTIRQLMINVVNTGSGKKAKPTKGGAGGKTGSAQTGIYDENDEEIVHAWFSGFFPADNPKYVVVVLNEGMDSGGDWSAPVFREIADRIENLEARRAEQ